MKNEMNFDSRVKLSTVIFLVLLVCSFTFSTFAKDNASSGGGVFSDFDQDGLSDEEEKTYGTDANNEDTDGDGYLDGTEVQTGYNPLKPAPGDKIVADNSSSVEGVSVEGSDVLDANLTKEIAEKILGVLNSGNEEGKDIAIDDIDGMVNDMISAGSTPEELPEIDESKIKIKKQGYSKYTEEEKKEKIAKDNEEYLVALAYLAVENSPYKISDPKDLEGFEDEVLGKVRSMSDLSSIASNLEYFENIAEKGESFLGQLENVEVPESMLEFHKEGIQVMMRAVALKDTVKIDTEDPIESLIAVSKAQNTLLALIDFYNKIDSELESMGVEDVSIEL